MSTYRDWPMYWTARVFDIPRERVYHLRDGPRLVLRTRTVDFRIVDEVFGKRVYEPSPNWIGKSDVVVDVGAHIGCFTAFAARRAREGKVIALEPHPGNFNLLRRNVALNRLRNVEALSVGLGAQSGQRRLYLSSFNVGGHSFYQPSGTSIVVDVIDLARLLERFNLDKVDLLKMDCEGAEHEILQSLPKGLLARIGKISFEYHELSPERSLSSLVRLLEDDRFELTVDEPSSMLHAWRAA